MRAERDRRPRDPDKRRRRRFLIVTLVSAGVVLAAAVFVYFFPMRTLLPAFHFPARAEGEMRVHFLDIGQGDATLVEFPEGDCLLIDAGDGSFEHENKLVRYIKGISPASLSVVATHADSDHCGGIAELLPLFEIETLYLPAVGSGGTEYIEMLERAAEEGIETKTAARYAAIGDPSGAYAVCISPHVSGETDENDSSTVFYLSYSGVEILLGADISSARERALMAEYALYEGIFDSGDLRVRLEDVDILRVSHHGSSASSSEEWLSLLGADVAVISCGADNRYGHPSAAAIERLDRLVGTIYRTDELGDIVVTISNGTYEVYTDYAN